MRTFVIRELIDLPKLTPGRRRQALERMRPVAAARGLVSLAAAIDAAILREDHALSLSLRWSRASEDRALHEEGAQALDALLDRSISTLFDQITLKGQVDPALAGASRSLLEDLFPKGPGEITGLPYVDESARVRTICAKLSAPPHSTAIATLGLGDWVVQIRELNERYSALLSRPERLTHADVVAADNAGHASLLGVIARVLGAYPDDTEADIEGRRALLVFYADQQDEMADLRARRRGEGLERLREGASEGTAPEGASAEGAPAQAPEAPSGDGVNGSEGTEAA